MGEYAQYNGEKIKIGTCEQMYYIRFEDRDKVSHKPGNVDLSDPVDVGCLRFRVPFIDEDHILPGEYEDYNRGLRLYRGHEDFRPAETPEPGSMFFRHNEAGLQFSVPCYHGEKLPDLGPEIKPRWNGKGYAYELASIRAVYDNGVLKTFPVVRCRFCSEQWRFTWDEVLPFVGDEEMRKRLDRRYNTPMTSYTCDFKTGLFHRVN